MAAGCSDGTPAKAGVREAQRRWIPAKAGKTAVGPHSFHGNGGDGAAASLDLPHSLLAASAARMARDTLTPVSSTGQALALSLEGEGTPERMPSLRVVVQHLAELLLGHARRAEQNQDDFRLEGPGLGKGRAGGLAHARMNRCRLRDRDYRHGFAFGEIGDDPGWEQPAELRQGLFHGLSVCYPVVEGYRNRASASLAVPGNGRQAVRHIGHVNGDGVQGEGVGGRAFLRQVQLRRHREVGDHGINGFPLYDATGESRQVPPSSRRLEKARRRR